MAKVDLTLAIGEYDHVRDLLDGAVRVNGVALNVLRLPVEEIFYRFTLHREWDVSEMSFAKVISLISQGDDSIVALPVFPSRVFRHSSIYTRKESHVEKPQDLAGKRIGVPEWAQTASVYSRGMLAHEYGVDLKSIQWYQGGVNEAGRVEKVKIKFPEGLHCTAVKDKSLSQMLLAGELDAIFSAREPAPFAAGDARVKRLFEDYPAAELAYWKKTGIYPIMHVVAMRRDVYERDRWLAMELYKGFEAAKRRSLERVREFGVSYFPVPWMAERARLSAEIMGADIWPYGIEPNRKTLEAFAQYAFEQGVCHRKVTVEELFAPETRASFRI